MKIEKRDGRIVEFDKIKISNAIKKAMNDVGYDKYDVSYRIANDISKLNKDMTVEEIQDLVEEKLMSSKLKDVARSYIRYRYDREKNRGIRSDLEHRFNEFKTLINGSNEEANKENSNKDTRIIPTMRDYLAGFACKEMAQKIIIPKDIINAHNEGIIHFHDMDYSPGMPMTNCCLINLEDMLQNGTVISGTLIEKPHSFRTACTIVTQIITQVASSQYGGNTINLAHLVPFVEISRKKIKEQIEYEIGRVSGNPELINELTEERLKEEIADGIQTIQYQLITMSTTNGQAPFTSVFMYLNDVESGQPREDMAMIIEEVLKQRIKGVKNEQGVYITTAFPKLLYVLDENNIHENSTYWYLTKLAAECTSKRLVPDYISAKKMKELKGDTYGCMGCLDGDEIITYKFYGFLFVESFKRMWERMSSQFEVKMQPNGFDKFIDLENVKIYDNKNGFVKTKRIIRNDSSNWLKIKMTNGRVVTCTDDHPFATDKGRILAKDLKENDIIPLCFNQYSKSYKNIDSDLAWAYGVLLCDGSYSSNVSASFALNNEDDIIEKLATIIPSSYNIEYKIIERHREKKGNYKEIHFYKSDKLKYDLISKFEGIAKKERHIPNEVFSWDYKAKCNFLAGMIDADGYVNNTRKLTKVQLGSTNKELALQQAALAQSLDMRAYIYENHYNSKDKSKVRYRVEFIPTLNLIQSMKCQKKINKYENNIRTNTSNNENDYGVVKEIEKLKLHQYSYDVTTESDYFDVSGIYTHNCRSFLTPDPINHKYWGRFNQGVITISLPDVALSSKKDISKFWNILDERLELCYRALMIRHNTLKGTKSDVAPILWQYGAYARLKPGETIDKLLYDNYSTISLGYAGLYECVKYMTGHSHTDNGKGKEFGIQVMKYLTDTCNKWREKTNISFSLYGTPIESTTYKFAKCLQKRFGIIEGITDKKYITNSYHITPSENIDAFTKLNIESEFQELSAGGSISYVETPNMTKNIDAVLEIIKHIYNNIMYAEINTMTSYCHKCGCTDIKMTDDFQFKCPQCGNDDFNKMNIALRVCGYISTNPFNEGRANDIYDRVYHLGME